MEWDSKCGKMDARKSLFIYLFKKEAEYILVKSFLFIQIQDRYEQVWLIMDSDFFLLGNYCLIFDSKNVQTEVNVQELILGEPTLYGREVGDSWKNFANYYLFKKKFRPEAALFTLPKGFQFLKAFAAPLLNVYPN